MRRSRKAVHLRRTLASYLPHFFLLLTFRTAESLLGCKFSVPSYFSSIHGQYFIPPETSLRTHLFHRGIVNTFGAFQTFYEADLLKLSNPSSISWIGSIQGFLLLNVGVLAGPMFDMGFFRSLLSAGSFMVVFGMLMTSFATRYYQVFLAQGFCVGIGGGFLFIPSVAVVATYFNKRRSFAIGLAASGSSVGESSMSRLIYIFSDPFSKAVWCIQQFSTCYSQRLALPGPPASLLSLHSGLFSFA